MVVINLLPWRNAFIRYRKRIIINMLIATLAFSTLVSAMIHYWTIERRNQLALRVEELKITLHRISQRGKKISHHDNELSKKLVLHQLVTSHLFLKLSQSPLQPICFFDIAHHHHKITIHALTRSFWDAMNFINTWNAAYLFSEVKLENFQQTTNGLMFRFYALEKSDDEQSVEENV